MRSATEEFVKETWPSLFQKSVGMISDAYYAKEREAADVLYEGTAMRLIPLVATERFGIIKDNYGYAHVFHCPLANALSAGFGGEIVDLETGLAVGRLFYPGPRLLTYRRPQKLLLPLRHVPWFLVWRIRHYFQWKMERNKAV